MKNDLLKILSLLVFSLFLVSCQEDEIKETSFYDCSLPFADSSMSHPSDADYHDMLDEITGSGVPGILMSVYSEADGMWLGAGGKADLKSNIGLQVCNMTRAGSTVKTFTAVTVLLLAEKGKLDLDGPVTDYLTDSDLEGLENADRATIRQLLQHSSGIYNYIQSLKFQTASLNDLIKEWEPEELLSYARGKKAYFEPGTDVLYSNTNYILLGMIITAIENKPFYEVFEEKIFTPLNLSFTRFAATDPVPGGIIRGYVDFYSNLDVINSTYYSGWDYYTADGGLISNAYDLNVFLTALFNWEIISKASLDEMLTWQKPKEEDPEFFPLWYGLGIFKMDTPWGDAYFHSGDAIGYYACMAYLPERSTTICWAVNGNYGKIDEFTSTKKAMEKIFGTVFD
ncbi:MAG: beta-lactamase family protein [Bacteroidales bacterium]|jgi:D-alanyl-D-alanine carboxypeptidase|nr:beta-lactamase family protein [Bacteroidales bacterium]